MQDGIIKGTGNSRYLRSIENFLEQYPTYQDFVAALVAGTLPIDLNGINESGWDLLGTALNKENLLSDESIQRAGLGSSAVPNDMWIGLVPVGGILWHTEATTPEGFFLCDGSTISRTNYAALFSVIGTTFGEGDGSTTFALPDLRAAFVRGAGSQDGYSATFGAKQESTYIGSPNPNDYNSVYTKLLNSDKTTSPYNVRRAFSETGTNDVSLFAYGVRPYNIALTPIIKY